MALAFPQADSPRALTGGADAWDGGAGALLLEDYFAADSGGTQQDLAGAAVAQGAATGALDHGVPLAGVAAASGTAAGGLAVTIPLAASAAAAAFAAAQLAIAKAMAGSATAQGGATAAVLLAKALAAAAGGQAQALGDLGLAKQLAAAALAGAGASGELQAAAVGTITTPPLKDNDGTLWANESGATAHVYTLAGALVVSKAAQSTNAAGVMAVADAAIAAGTPYRVVFRLASGAEGMETITAA